MPPFFMPIRRLGPGIDVRSLEPMTAIVRVAVVVVTLALFFGTSFNALQGHRDIAIMLALATPLGISAWGFARAGHNEAAVALLCCVLITVITLILLLNPLGVHDVAVTAYAGILVIAALLLSRRAFYAIAGLTIFSASAAFAADLLGFSRSQIGQHARWPQYVDFLMIASIFAIVGRYASETLFGSIGDAYSASRIDAASGVLNRPAFIERAVGSLKILQSEGRTAVLFVVDIDAFRRINLVVGHDAADRMLAEIARRLEGVAGTREFILGRIGDDEFALLGIDVPDDAASEFARALHASVNFEHLGVSVRSAAGYSRFPRDAHTIESLMLGAQSGVASAKTRVNDRISGPADRI